MKNAPLLMGILNVTPDSFSDGGKFLDRGAAIERGVELVEDGADWIDVGGESTRPGADPVDAEEEMRRVLPVIEVLARQGIRVSIDTSKAIVARAAIQSGATMVNDVTSLSDPDMAETIRTKCVRACLMHMQGTPRTMQENPTYVDVVREVRSALVASAEALGIDPGKTYIDPGIGFGKTVEHNLQLLRHLDQFVATGYPVLIGLSRKSFIGRILGDGPQAAPTEERLEGTLILQGLAQIAGASMIRTHDVREAARVRRVISAYSSVS